MSQAIATIDAVPPEMWRGKELDLIKSQIALNCTDDELMLFSKICQRTGLDPFTKQIYAIKRGKKMTIQTGIDGYRLMAARTGELAGIDDAEYDTEDADYPTWAKVTVWRLTQGVRCPFSAKARWSEYHQEYDGKLADMWMKFPYLMLGKCAEALALRKAFPAELSGVYTSEEMDQADYVDAPPASTPTARQATHSAPRPSSAKPKPETVTIEALQAQVAEWCKAEGISQEALKAWMNWSSNRYSAKNWNHLDDMLKRMRSEADAQAGLHLQELAIRNLLSVENLVGIIRRRSGDLYKTFENCWVTYTQNKLDWDAVIDEEKAASAA